MNDAEFRSLELINVKCDVLIDEEDYEKVFEIITLGNKKTKYTLNEELGKNPSSKRCNAYLLKICNPKNLPEVSVDGLNLTDKKFRLWLPLFLAKAVRAYISKNGSDTAMACLDDVLMYLHRHLPTFPKSGQDFLLQHLYFQELAACGKPGLESLGYARRAADVLESTKDLSRQNYSTELYKLWSALNQGIGYWHSGQRREAALKFNDIIKEFKEKFNQAVKTKSASDDDKKYWQALLYDQAVLFRAELHENLQFSHHTIQTLQRLDDPDHPNAKREKRLIKEALAYRDMRRLNEALNKIKQLLQNGESLDDSDATLMSIFDRFEHWKLRKQKAGIWSETAGLLFDFYLTRFEDLKPNKHDITTFTSKLIQYADALMKSKPERVSYVQQIARYLRWLSDKYKGSKDGRQKKFYETQIETLYSHLRSPRIKKKIKLKDFGRYDYDMYVDSIEHFYKNWTNTTKLGNTKKEECDFLEEVMKYEKEQFYLYEFKEMERRQRIRILANGPAIDCAEPSKCFDVDGRDFSFFRGLLNCNPDVTEPDQSNCCDLLSHCDYESIMMKENGRFLEYLKYNSIHPIPISKQGRGSFHFMGLQRWNSQTPTLTLSQGGGYLLYKQDKRGVVSLGIAIDPGFDFVDNLFHMGFTLKDIDFILLTHAHLDHIRDFEPIVTALLDLKKREKGQKVKGKIHAIMSLGVYRKLENIITNNTLREFLADTYIVDIDREIVDRSNDDNFPSIRFMRNRKGTFISVIDDEFDIEIEPTKAYHDDYSERSDSFGYIIRVSDADCSFSFGYSGDTRWGENSKSHNTVDHQYRGCDVVCIHLGALIESEDENNKKNKFDYYRGKHCEELIEKKWHPYLFGLLRWIKAIKTDEQNKNKLILLSEFGEELKGGIRIDLVQRLNEMFPDKSQRVCIPVDIGLNVVLSKQRSETSQYQVWCSGCNSYVSAEKIRYRHFGYGRGDEALFYFCDTCLKSKPPNILEDKMRHVCESGIPLRKHEAINNR